MSDYSEWSVYEINSAILTLKVKATGYKPRIDLAKDGCSARCLNTLTEFDYNNPADAWPLILENKINIGTSIEGRKDWCAWDWECGYEVWHNNPLRAAMIVYLMMKEAGHG